jgi:Cytochrome P450
LIGTAVATTRSIADLPGPTRLPLLGNTHQMRPSSLHLTVEEWCERYGPIFRFDLGPRRIVAVDDLEEINRICGIARTAIGAGGRYRPSSTRWVFPVCSPKRETVGAGSGACRSQR